MLYFLSEHYAVFLWVTLTFDILTSTAHWSANYTQHGQPRCQFWVSYRTFRFWVSGRRGTDGQTATQRYEPANGWSALGLNTVGCATVPCIGNVVMPAVGDSTVGVAAAAAAWNVPSNRAINKKPLTNSVITRRCFRRQLAYQISRRNITAKFH